MVGQFIYMMCHICCYNYSWELFFKPLISKCVFLQYSRKETKNFRKRQSPFIREGFTAYTVVYVIFCSVVGSELLGIYEASDSHCIESKETRSDDKLISVDFYRIAGNDYFLDEVEVGIRKQFTLAGFFTRKTTERKGTSKTVAHNLHG